MLFLPVLVLLDVDTLDLAPLELTSPLDLKYTESDYILVLHGRQKRFQVSYLILQGWAESHEALIQICQFIAHPTKFFY